MKKSCSKLWFGIAVLTVSKPVWAQAANAGQPATPHGAAPNAPAPGQSPAGDQAAETSPAPPMESPLVTQLKQQVNTQQMALGEQDARLKALEDRLTKVNAELERRRAREKKERQRREALQRRPPPPEPWYHSIHFSGFIQAQYENHQESEDQLAQGGEPLNLDRFLVRRARLIAESEARFTAFALELDGNTVSGPAFGLQRAEATVLWRGPHAGVEHPALAALTVGMFYPPFGHELVASSRKRWFMERSLESRGFFPSEPDIGVRLAGQLGFFDYGVAIVNGDPKGDRTGFQLRDPNAAKDVIGRLGVRAHVSDAVDASGGVSVLDGKGFFAGTDNTKAGPAYSDKDENGAFTAGEVNAVGGTGLRSKNFKHWAVGADVQVGVQSLLGRTEIGGEVVIASNLDRGVFVADPVGAHFDIREFGINAFITQDVFQHAIVGFRYDYYDPQGDIFGLQNAQLIPVSETVTTYSPLVGLKLPERSRLIVQYDIIRDHMAIDTIGVPADRKNNALTLRLQGEL